MQGRKQKEEIISEHYWPVFVTFPVVAKWFIAPG